MDFFTQYEKHVKEREALGVPLWYILREVSERLAVLDGTVVPDTVPENLVPVTLIS